MRFCKWLWFIFMLSLMITSCTSKQDSTEQPTRSSEDVLRTAEAIAEMTRQSSTNTPEPIPTEVIPSATVVELSPTPKPTETPISPKVRADYNANVRSGPDEVYPVIDFFLAGEEADVIGLNIHPTMGTWWYIKRIGQGLNGWVWGGRSPFLGMQLESPTLKHRQRQPRPQKRSKQTRLNQSHPQRQSPD